LREIDTAMNQSIEVIQNAFKLKEFKVDLAPEILYQRIEE
jgi:hypothetical protein